MVIFVLCQICYITDSGPAVRMSLRVKGFANPFAHHAVRSIIIPLAALVFKFRRRSPRGSGVNALPRLCWLASIPVSCLHTARVLLRRSGIDTAVGQGMAFYLGCGVIAEFTEPVRQHDVVFAPRRHQL